jgi:hypothetical protein
LFSLADGVEGISFHGLCSLLFVSWFLP